MIGGMDGLFAAFADHCSSKWDHSATVDVAVEWKALLLAVSVEMHRSRSKVSFG